MHMDQSLRNAARLTPTNISIIDSDVIVDLFFLLSANLATTGMATTPAHGVMAPTATTPVPGAAIAAAGRMAGDR